MDPRAFGPKLAAKVKRKTIRLKKRKATQKKKENMCFQVVVPMANAPLPVMFAFPSVAIALVASNVVAEDASAVVPTNGGQATDAKATAMGNVTPQKVDKARAWWQEGQEA